MASSDDDSKTASSPIEILKDLNRRRGSVKGRLTNFAKYVRSFDGQSLPLNQRAELKLRIQGASNLYTEFTAIQNKIDRMVSESELPKQLEARDSFESQYYDILARAQCIVDDDKLNDDSNGPSSSYFVQSVKLPTISLPTYDGSCEHWLEFRDTFQSLVHNSKDITKIQKFHYLKSSLTGNARLVIDSLEFSADNYTIAWELLLNRYNNSRLLVHNHVKALFSIQALTKESPALLRTLIDSILKNLRALKLLGEPTDTWDTLIIYMVVSKLDPVTEREWEQFKGSFQSKLGDSRSSPTIDDLLNFLRDRADVLETLIVTHTKALEHRKHSNSQNVPKVHCNLSTDNSNKNKRTQHKPSPCLKCNGKHPLYSCQAFIDSNLQDKWKLVRDNKLCENCFRTGHTSTECRYGPCRKCNKKHNSLIHFDAPNEDEVKDRTVSLLSIKEEVSTSQPIVSSVIQPQAQSYTTQVNKTDTEDINAQLSLAQPVLLSTAIIEIPDASGIYQRARAILDSGSERCFITQSLCDKLDVQLIQSTQNIQGVGNTVTQCTQTCNIVIKSITSTYVAQTQCLVLPRITTTLPSISLQKKHFKIPHNIQLADPTFYECQSIDVLIGADLFWDLLDEGKMRLANGPFLQNTKLGWIISGSVQTKTKYSQQINCNFTQTVDLQSIDTQLRRFWDIEELPISKQSDGLYSDEESLCEDHFVKTTKRDQNGRFCVQIPFKESPESLGQSYEQAERRFYALEKRLERNPSYKKLYSDFINEYIRLGHMSKVNSYGTPHYFLPHHGVFREHATTTKLRVVFDASAVTTSKKSLNDIQLVGPPVQGDLFAMLLRFRENRYVACADIEKMYRQVTVAEQQRDLQLIIWRERPSDSLGIYRLNTVTYGTASAPFLSCRCLKQLANDTEREDPEVARIIRDQFYVDDLICGADSIHDLTKTCEKIKNILKAACFPLHKWVFNFDCSAQIDSVSKELSLGEHVHSKTLGLGWYNRDDQLHFHTQLDTESKVVTKRIILSYSSQIFDPLGLLSPLITIAKTLLQKLWLLKLGWDEPVPDDVARVWNTFVISLSTLNSIRVPRYVMCCNYKSLELHIFSDASQTAYGACAYVRTVDNRLSVTVRLLCSKGRVAPISSPITIPKLELCGALVAARLYSKIINSLRCQFDKVTFWTDSTIVLGWLRMPPNLLKTYVQNRTAEIHRLTKENAWRHVRGKDNPADLISRGLGLVALKESILWWEGPRFLHDVNFDCSHSEDNQLIDNQILPEVRNINVNSLVINETNCTLFPFSRFSQFNRMKRAAAYVLRFIYNTRNKTKRSGALSVDELSESVTTLARLSQIESFPDEYSQLTNKGIIKRKRSLSKLNLFMDESKLIRVGGRIQNSPQFDFDKRHPILISSKHYFTVLLFKYEHKQLLHAAPMLLLYTLRETWWTLGGRNLAKFTVHGCVTCARLRGRTLNPLMGNLPKERLEPGFPFLRCGVDYAGPMLILNRKGRGSKTVKSYICLFVCFTTRAVHLELVSELSSNAYLLALKRFISRRGKPAEIFSDNGKNFVGVMNDFAKFLTSCSADIIDYASSQNITFRMIPPYASHFGGLWEAGVKSCKHHLKRVMGNSHLSFEEFSTVLTQIEAILNSRPLTPMSADPHDCLPLSPAHFLVGRPLTAPVCADLHDVPVTRLTRYQRVEQIRQHFWARWSREYVSELQMRTKWTEKKDELKLNTLVLIKDDNSPPLKWNLGRIVKTYPGKDGVSRVADVKTANGIIRRALTKICPLPV